MTHKVKIRKFYLEEVKIKKIQVRPKKKRNKKNKLNFCSQNKIQNQKNI